MILGVTGGLVFLGMMYGPQAAFFAELFSTEVRYSGASLGYQIGAIIGGSFAPTIATLLWKNYDIFWVSVYIAFASLLSLLSVYFLTETYTVQNFLYLKYQFRFRKSRSTVATASILYEKDWYSVQKITT